MNVKGFRFCGQCLDDITEPNRASAFCKECKEFICSDQCLKQHAKFKLTKTHAYLFDDDLKKVIKELGIDTKPSSFSDPILDGADGTPYLQANLRTEINVRVKEDREICSIHASIVLQNGCIVVADLKNESLKLFDTAERNCKAFLKVNHGPRDICISNKDDNEIFLIETGIKSIHVVNTDDLTITRDIPTSGECFGVCCWKEGVCVTTKIYNNYHGQYAIQLLNYSGRLMRNMIASKYKNLEFNLPWYLCSDQAGQRVIMSDFGNHTVSGIDVDTGVLFVYKDSELIRPVSLTMNGVGDIFVVGQRSHNIHHISDFGVKKGIIYSESPMEFPGGIAFDTINNIFYVQCVGWSDSIQVFDLEPTMSSSI
ncbi:hypothetical protein ACF0H5_018334 [Mactra antiquata]